MCPAVPPELCYQGLVKLAFYLLLLMAARTVALSRQWVGLLQVLLTSFHFVYFSKNTIMLCVGTECCLIHIYSEWKCYFTACVYGHLRVSTLFKYSHFPNEWVGQDRTLKISMGLLCHPTFLSVLGNIQQVSHSEKCVKIASTHSSMNNFLWFLVYLLQEWGSLNLWSVLCILPHFDWSLKMHFIYTDR